MAALASCEMPNCTAIGKERTFTVNAAAVRDYAANANELLGQCSQRYTALAAKAVGHALDARVCRAAWPVKVVTP